MLVGAKGDSAGLSCHLTLGDRISGTLNFQFINQKSKLEEHPSSGLNF